MEAIIPAPAPAPTPAPAPAPADTTEMKIILTTSGTQAEGEDLGEYPVLKTRVPLTQPLEPRHQYTDRLLHTQSGKWIYFLQCPASSDTIMAAAKHDSSVEMALQLRRIRQAYEEQLEAYSPVWIAHRAHVHETCRLGVFTLDALQKYARQYGVLETNVLMMSQMDLDREFILTFESIYTPAREIGIEYVWGPAPHCLLSTIYRLVASVEVMIVSINETMDID